MSSALKPALPPASGQTSPGNATSAAGKAVMSPGGQGMTQHSASAASYPSGPLAHVPQNLTGLAHAHGNIGMSATNSTNMAANISVNAVPNMSQMGSHSAAVNQGTPLNVPGPTKAAGGGGTGGAGAAIPASSSSVPTSSAAGTTAAAATTTTTVVPHGRPTAHPYLSSVTATSASATRDEEGTTLPASQNSAQLMAVHKAQQNQQPQQHHHPQQSQQSPQQQQQSQPQQPHHNDQNIHTDRFKQNQQQPQQQTPQQQQQATTAQSNGTMSGPADATCNKTTVPTPPATADAKTESSPQTAVPPPVQNHVPTPSSTVTHEQNNTTKQPVDATTPTSTAVPPIPPPAAPPTSASSEPKPTPAAVTTPSAAEPATEPSQTVASTPTKAAVVPKETPTKTPSTLKLATTPRTTNRKRETKMTKTSDSPKGNATSSVKTTDGRSPGAQNNKPPDRTPKNARTVSDEDRKSKRTRTRTQPYQSPLPELALISKLSSAAGSSSPSKAHDEKLIVFYKNEFLAVRNAEGGFYVCQAVQNVYKSSPRIRIRWLSQDKQDKIYIPDFYDFTDFDCILTNLNMERVEKGKYNLPKDELERTENILKRALAVESGGSAPSLTEEHPDGLDLSLFRDESQLKKKRKSAKRKSTEPLSASSGDLNNSRTRKTPDKMKVRKVSKSPATKSTIKRNNQQAQSDRRTTVNATSASGNNEKKDGAGRTSRRSDSGRAERAKRRNESTGSTASKTSPVVDPKKARVLAKVALKTAIPAAAIVAVAQSKKKVGRTAPTTKVSTGNASSVVKVGTKTLTRSSQAAPASSTAAAAATAATAATIVTTAAASSAPSTRRGKKTKK